MVGHDDTVASSDLPLSAYEQALEPKQLAILPGGHYAPTAVSRLNPQSHRS